MRKKVVISWSSGKDSTLTLERLLNDPSYEVVGLYTTYVGDEVPFQVTPLSVVEMQAKLIGLPLILIELPEVFPANEIYQSTIIKALKQSNLEIDAVAFGDMFCNGIADYRRSYIEPAGWECVFPLMGQSSSDLADEIINLGIQTWLVTVDGNALNSEFCGKLYTKELLEAFPEDVDPCGEDGEFHTLVTHAPCFNGYLEINKTEIEKGERFTHQRYEAILYSE
ncbi:ATPase [Vibrio sp. 99-70-13A1]|uniref:Dph6-related ATP pyrophosphatase n=1 Tax=Vibrio sp. 99-70-13A1 TaxID=2607601 RepID=UPI001493C0EF|nr:ATPase [Vibrio sp. 99-70-13A1]NOH96518.1 ATPase [Vibrio sp. 99-70-13A1]